MGVSNQLLTATTALVFVVITLLNRSSGTVRADGGNYTVPPADDVIFTTIIHRHGARTPTFIYPADPNVNAPQWQIGVGQLTTNGKNQTFELGKLLRRRYNGLLPQTYHYKDIYVYSTDVDRTLMSAECNMAGLYIPLLAQVFNDQIPTWQPVPVHSNKFEDDNMLLVYKECPRYTYELKKLFQSDEFKKYELRYKKLADFLTAKNYPIKKLSDFEKVNDIFTIERDDPTLEWPAWLTDDIYGAIQRWSFLSQRTQTYNHNLKRLATGVFFNQQLQHLKEKIAGNLTQKMWVYSGHDTTLINILQTLGVTITQPPSYAAAIFIDLRHYGGQYFVSTYYRESDVDELRLIQIPGCGFKCHIAKFEAILSELMLTDAQWNEACQLRLMERIFP